MSVLSLSLPPQLQHYSMSPSQAPQEVICLVPELCCMTGLTDYARSDFRVMKVRASCSMTTIGPQTPSTPPLGHSSPYSCQSHCQRTSLQELCEEDESHAQSHRGIGWLGSQSGLRTGTAVWRLFWPLLTLRENTLQPAQCGCRGRCRLEPRCCQGTTNCVCELTVYSGTITH